MPDVTDRPDQTPTTDWHFYVDGDYQPVPEQVLRDFTASTRTDSGCLGMAGTAMEQMWAEIDRLRGWLHLIGFGEGVGSRARMYGQSALNGHPDPMKEFADAE